MSNISKSICFIFLLFSFFFSHKIVAQNTNSKQPKDSALAVNADNKIYLFGTRYKYKNKIIRERTMNKLLLNSGDKSIIDYGLIAKKDRRRRLWVLGAIPLGVAAVPFLFTSSIFISQGQNSTSDNLYFGVGCILMGGAIACPIASMGFNGRYKYYRGVAIKLYNQKY